MYGYLLSYQAAFDSVTWWSIDSWNSRVSYSHCHHTEILFHCIFKLYSNFSFRLIAVFGEWVRRRTTYICISTKLIADQILCAIWIRDKSSLHVKEYRFQYTKYKNVRRKPYKLTQIFATRLARITRAIRELSSKEDQSARLSSLFR